MESLLEPFIPDALSAYFISDASNYACVLKIEALSCSAEASQAEGWMHSQENGKHRAAFCSRHQILFALTYNEELREILVEVKSGSQKSLSLGVQHAILLALSPSCIGLHAVSLICGNKLIALSAPSGTGKTTLANLLRKHCQAALINGDFALLSISEDGVIFEPTPFCGTSGRCLNYRLQLEEIVFLSQSPDNVFRFMDTREALIRLLSNVFVPAWDQNLTDKVHANTCRIMEKIRAASLAFAPHKEAAELLDQMVNK